LKSRLFRDFRGLTAEALRGKAIAFSFGHRGLGWSQAPIGCEASGKRRTWNGQTD
jgi:hypothetical protein